MLYYDTKLQARQSEGQVARRGLDASLGLSHYGIYPMGVSYPEGFDFELFSAIDGGDAGDVATGFRVDWKEVPKEHSAVVKVLKGRLASRRYDIEIGGVALAEGVSAKTDRETQAMINGALKLFELDPTLVQVDFKGTAGFVTFTKVQIEAMAVPIGRMVQACFSRERGISEAIDAAGEDTELAIQTYKDEIGKGWPENSYLLQQEAAEAAKAAEGDATV